MGSVDLGFRNIIIDGVDGFNYVQVNDSEDVADQDSITIYVNGVPRLVQLWRNKIDYILYIFKREFIYFFEKVFYL